MDEINDTGRRRVLGAVGAASLVSSLLAGQAVSAEAAAALSATPQSVPPVTTQFAFEAQVGIAAPVTIGESSGGLRRLIPITGGSFAGPRIRGEVVPGGADWQLVRPDGVTTVEAKYTLRASDGALVFVTNRGIIVRGDNAYVRTAPEFEAPTGAHDWLNKSLFVGTLDASQVASHSRVIIRVFQVI